ncbi:MAG: transglycosylase domain-containing protein [Ruminococcus callidus]|nr:transglycosylase domain-containing protein [Ruminococcus callidus]
MDKDQSRNHQNRPAAANTGNPPAGKKPQKPAGNPKPTTKKTAAGKQPMHARPSGVPLHPQKKKSVKPVPVKPSTAAKPTPPNATPPKPAPEPSPADPRELVIYQNDTDSALCNKPPTGTPEYPYYNEVLQAEKPKRFPMLRKAFSILCTTLVSLFLICIITGTIVATGMTVYVMSFRDEVSEVTIEELEMKNNTYVYANDANGELVCLYKVNNRTERIPVTIDKIPQHVKDAFVSAEDERFYTHEGVDYRRTFYAFVNMFIHIYNTDVGGSTITQQLVKNITGDDVQSPARKIREIFRAMELEQNYSKDEILENYLNYIGFGGPINGIQLASQQYFGKDVSELDIAEAASLAAIPKSPNSLNPFAGYEDETTGEFVNTGKEANKKRQKYVLRQMYDNGSITYDEYQAALNEELLFTDSQEYQELHPEEENEYLSAAATSWVVDTAIYEFADYLEKTYNLSSNEAIARINAGGYQIATTVDLDMQSYVEEKYKDLNNLVGDEEVGLYLDENGDGEYTTEEILYPESAFIAMDYEGNIKAIVGSIGEKTDSLCWNYATMEPRQPGSTIKPLTTYGLALENDTIHWGSVFTDEPLKQIDDIDWPVNYSNTYSHSSVFAYDALAKSLNTVPAKICDQLGTQPIFDFAREKLGLKLDDISNDNQTDNDLAPLSLGALTYGVTLENLVSSYIPYGNGGTHYEPHIIKWVKQGEDTLIYENDGSPRKAVSSETAYVMNKLLQNVVENGTGDKAKLENKHVAGKTGTTENWYDLTFVGLTEDFVSGVWIGYTKRQSLPDTLESDQIWYNIIGEYADKLHTNASYPTNDDVVEGYVCAKSGKIAGSHCKKLGTGYWKSTNAPVCDECTGYNYTIPSTTPSYDTSSGESSSEEGQNSSQGGESSGDNSGGDTGNTGGDTGNTGGDTSGGDTGNSGGGEAGGDSTGGGEASG